MAAGCGQVPTKENDRKQSSSGAERERDSFRPRKDRCKEKKQKRAIMETQSTDTGVENRVQTLSKEDTETMKCGTKRSSGHFRKTQNIFLAKNTIPLITERSFFSHLKLTL